MFDLDTRTSRMVFREAVALHRSGDLAGAERLYRELPDMPGAWVNLAIILRSRDETDEAEALLRKAVVFAPGYAPGWRALGNLLWHGSRNAEATAAYEQALAIDPNDDVTAFELGRMKLLSGGLAEGWALMERRSQAHKDPTIGLSAHRWQGEPLEGKHLLIWPEQGLGDHIFAARFVPQLQGAKVTLVARPPLCRLFSGLGATVIPLDGGAAVPPYDYWTLPFSLPRWVDPRELPTRPYLQGEATTKGGVGIAWRGNPLPDPGRSLPAELGAELLSWPDAISLLPEDTGARDFQDTADLIAGLDAVVTIDTSIAHLAGALGAPTWLLLQHDKPDWRWRESEAGPSLWYPSIRIARQPSRGDWRSAVEQVRLGLPDGVTTG